MRVFIVIFAACFLINANSIFAEINLDDWEVVPDARITESKNDKISLEGLKAIPLEDVLDKSNNPDSEITKSKNSQKSLESIQQAEMWDKLKNEIDIYTALSEKITNEKHTACMKAFGNEKFCTCITNESPADITFTDYITIVTSTKKELEDSSLDHGNKTVIDNTIKAREICVASEQ